VLHKLFSKPATDFSVEEGSYLHNFFNPWDNLLVTSFISTHTGHWLMSKYCNFRINFNNSFNFYGSKWNICSQILYDSNDHTAEV